MLDILEEVKFPDGTSKSYYGYYEGGQLKSEILVDGTKRTYFQDGKTIKSETLPDGTEMAYDNFGHRIK